MQKEVFDSSTRQEDPRFVLNQVILNFRVPLLADFGCCFFMGESPVGIMMCQIYTEFYSCITSSNVMHSVALHRALGFGIFCESL